METSKDGLVGIAEQKKVRHPAKYSDVLLPVFAEVAQGSSVILDCMAGTGEIFKLRGFGITAKILAYELEPEWCAMHPETQLGNALNLPLADSYVDCIIVSPPYANRLADSHTARDSSRRNTYTHAIGRKLHQDNAGAMQWGQKYRDFHVKAWTEAKRVLQPSGKFVLNIKDHYRAGKRIHVTDWHCEALQSLGFTLIEHRQIDCPGLRHGANSGLRMDYESVILFQL
jgi:SAM-dependent methyltransferase